MRIHSLKSECKSIQKPPKLKRQNDKSSVKVLLSFYQLIFKHLKGVDRNYSVNTIIFLSVFSCFCQLLSAIVSCFNRCFYQVLYLLVQWLGQWSVA